MQVVNTLTCEPDDSWEQGAFRAGWFDLTERLGAEVIGATVFEMGAGEKLGPYHFHDGFEEWLYVVCGTPLLREPAGERRLDPADLVAFTSGPAGAHTVSGPGRVVIFSAGKRGWGEAWISAYPDSDKIAAKGGVIFRRADAIRSWVTEPHEKPSGSGPSSAAINLTAASLTGDWTRSADGVHELPLGLRLGALAWAATLYELAPGAAIDAYHYKWCREEWALVVSGAPTLRHADGETLLGGGDICCFPQGPTGVHRLGNASQQPARLIVFSTSTERPMSAFYPEEETVLIQISERERLLFRQKDRIDDYWDGEPGAA